MSALGGLFDRLLEALTWLAGAALTFAMLLVSLEICLRYVFNTTLLWTVQITEYILLYLPFLAAAYVLRREEHITLDILIRTLAPAVQRRLNLVTSAIGTLVCGVLGYYGSDVAWDYYVRDVPRMEAVKIPAFLVTMVIPIGFAALAIQFVRRALAIYRTPAEEIRL